jgi:hypothetical protein
MVSDNELGVNLLSLDWLNMSATLRRHGKNLAWKKSDMGLVAQW